MNRSACIALSCLALAGCAGVPRMEFEGPSFSRTDKVTGSEALVRHLLCEITRAETFKGLAERDYVAVVNLNLTAEDNLGAAPSLSFITPKSVASTSDTAILGGEFSKKRERYFAQDLQFNLKDLVGVDYCGPIAFAPELRGDLGVTELMERRSTLGYGPPSQARPEGSLEYDAYQPSVTKFGTTAKFTMKWGAAAGPQIVRIHFKGPSDKGLFSASRTDVSSLAVAFSRKKSEPSLADVIAELRRQREGSAALSEMSEDQLRAEAEARIARSRADASAADQARLLINQMVLQNLTVSPR